MTCSKPFLYCSVRNVGSGHSYLNGSNLIIRLIGSIVKRNVYKKPALWCRFRYRVSHVCLSPHKTLQFLLGGKELGVMEWFFEGMRVSDDRVSVTKNPPFVSLCSTFSSNGGQYKLQQSQQVSPFGGNSPTEGRGKGGCRLSRGCLLSTFRLFHRV